MAAELEQIIRNADTLEGSIDRDRLAKYTKLHSAKSIPMTWRIFPRLTELHILGGWGDLLQKTKSEWYLDPVGKWMLVRYPSMDFVFMGIPLPVEKVEVLDIRFTQISKLSLSAVTGVKRLNLANNPHLKTVENLSQLTLLEELDIHGTNLERFEVIGECTNLRSLDASGVRLQAPRFLTRLELLTELKLRGSEINVFPNLEHLTHLKHLDLSRAMLPEVIESSFPDSLESLSLAHATIKQLPDGIGKLQNLKCLDLSGLRLQELPDWLGDLGLKFHREGTSGIILGDTVFEGIDMTLFDQPQEVIRQWFRERRAADRLVPMNEVKVVFLGDGGAGKSLVIERLMNNNALPDQYVEHITHGISIQDKTFVLDGREVTIHFWDFGGQELLHSLHQMFLTNRTIYVVVVNAGEPSYRERIRYWMQTLQSFAGECPVMIALNKIDLNPNAYREMTGISDQYPELKALVQISAAKDNTERFAQSFTDVLLRLIAGQPLLNTMLPASWKLLRRELSSDGRACISKEDFESYCNISSIPPDRDTREELLSWFHDLGICFGYKGNPILEDYVVLRPDWISHALMKILFGLRERASHGIVEHQDIAKILCYERSGSQGYVYSISDMDYILSVMRQFHFSAMASGSNELIPALLDHDPQPVLADFMSDPSVSEFRIEYEYLPIALLHRLMVMWHSGLNAYNAWYSGAQFVFHKAAASALVVCSGNRLTIYIMDQNDSAGIQNHVRNLRFALEQIQQDLGLRAGLFQIAFKYDGECEWFDYDSLAEMVHRGETECYSFRLDRMIPISDILEHTDQMQQEEHQRIVSSILNICERMQGDRRYWDSSEEERVAYLRDSLVRQGHVICDQSIDGVHERDVSIDIRRRTDYDRPWILGETMSISGSAQSDRKRWAAHEGQLVGEYESNLAMLFTVTFVTCRKDHYAPVMENMLEYIRDYTPRPPDQELVEFIKVVNDRPYLDAIRCVYRTPRGYATVYHFFVRIGFERVLEQKREERRTAPTNEYKVVFLGDGEAGKSLTVARLHKPDLDVKSFNGDVTPGIDIKSRVYEISGQNVQVNFWDFGGQEILYSMHRLFLSERTVYVVILNSRNDTQDDRARFWLRYINTYVKKAPVILVLNKIDQNENASVNVPELCRQFENVDVRKVLRISALVWDQEVFRRDFVEHLEQVLRDCVEIQASSYIQNWLKIRDELRQWKRPLIRMEEFDELCRKYGVEDAESRSALLKKLEDNGICICFRGDVLTEQYRLLEPKWITNAIYAILFNLHSKANNGIIRHELFYDCLMGAQKEDKKPLSVYGLSYEPEEVDFVLKVMRSYRFSFEIPETRQEFVPMLCPREEPAELGNFLAEDTYLEFHMCFEYLPADVLYQFMVARLQAVQDSKWRIWLTGVLLTDEHGCQAAVIKEGNVLRFLISRSEDLPYARSYMESLRHDVDLIIHRQGIPKPEIRVVYRYQNIAEVFDYERLILSERCGLMNVASKKLKGAITIRNILEQTFHSEEVLYETLLGHVVKACGILQQNFDYWGKTESELNRHLRDMLRIMDHTVVDQPELGASSTWVSSGRPDLWVNFENGASSVLIEALKITGTGDTDAANWDEHMSRMTKNYNCSGFRMMILVSYASCTQDAFAAVDEFYHKRMQAFEPDGGLGSMERCEYEQRLEQHDYIRVTRADYYNRGYTPTVYHILVRIPRKTEKPADTDAT